MKKSHVTITEYKNQLRITTNKPIREDIPHGLLAVCSAKKGHQIMRGFNTGNKIEKSSFQSKYSGLLKAASSYFASLHSGEYPDKIKVNPRSIRYTMIIDKRAKLRNKKGQFMSRKDYIKSITEKTDQDKKQTKLSKYNKMEKVTAKETRKLKGKGKRTELTY
jgi:hypothetical protein